MANKKLTIRERIDDVENKINILSGDIDLRLRELSGMIEDVFVLCQKVCDSSYEMVDVNEWEDVN